MTPKKSILIFAVIVFSLIVYGTAFSKNKALEKERLKMKNNKISVMNEFLFFPKTNSQKKKSVQSFDENGNKISLVELDNEEKQIKKIEYTYDSKNNESSFTEFGASGEIKQKCVNKYDPGNEFLIEEQFYNAGNVLVYRRISKPDKFYNVSEQVLYDKTGKLLGKSSNKYDNAGNRIEALSYDAANNFNGRYVYNYDKAGNLIEAVTYDKNNKFAGKKINNYDQKGLLTESIGYNAAGTANSWRKYEYELQKAPKAVEAPIVTEVKTVAQNKTSEVSVAAKSAPAVPVKPKVENTETPVAAVSDANVPEIEKTEFEKIFNKDDPYNPPVDAVMSAKDLIGFCAHSKKETIMKLIEKNNIDVNSINELGQTMLMTAALGGKADLVEELIKHGARLDLKDIKDTSVLDYAKAGKSQSVIRLINEAAGK
ncbi:MAG TPA: ankyrin repeat domain-containing protein [Candidatus Wallbacteria bacterium]|nr:ankyrin repeat domain-containing protein [Candidatus Wallbacteria bacterium]